MTQQVKCRHTSIFLPILAFFSANIGSKKCAKHHRCNYCFPTSIGIFAASASSFYRLWLLKTHFWYFLPILAFFHLFAYNDFQNFRRSSARSRTKTKIVNKDASIGGKDDDHWRFQFCYRYWQKKTPVLAENARNVLV